MSHGDFQKSAVLIIDDDAYHAAVKHGGQKTRYVKIPYKARKQHDSYPGTATVKWSGNSYRAQLAARRGPNGQRIPVYEFRLKS